MGRIDRKKKITTEYTERTKVRLDGALTNSVLIRLIRVHPCPSVVTRSFLSVLSVAIVVNPRSPSPTRHRRKHRQFIPIIYHLVAGGIVLIQGEQQFVTFKFRVVTGDGFEDRGGSNFARQ
jgi:hypothetical protein